MVGRDASGHQRGADRARVAILSRISLGGDLRRVDSGVVERQLQVQLLIVKLLHQILKYKLKHNFKYKNKYWRFMTQPQLQLVDQSFSKSCVNTSTVVKIETQIQIQTQLCKYKHKCKYKRK